MAKICNKLNFYSPKITSDIDKANIVDHILDCEGCNIYMQKNNLDKMAVVGSILARMESSIDDFLQTDEYKRRKEKNIQKIKKLTGCSSRVGWQEKIKNFLVPNLSLKPVFVSLILLIATGWFMYENFPPSKIKTEKKITYQIPKSKNEAVNIKLILRTESESVLLNNSTINLYNTIHFNITNRTESYVSIFHIKDKLISEISTKNKEDKGDYINIKDVSWSSTSKGEHIFVALASLDINRIDEAVRIIETKGVSSLRNDRQFSYNIKRIIVE